MNKNGWICKQNNCGHINSMDAKSCYLCKNPYSKDIRKTIMLNQLETTCEICRNPAVAAGECVTLANCGHAICLHCVSNEFENHNYKCAVMIDETICDVQMESYEIKAILGDKSNDPSNDIVLDPMHRCPVDNCDFKIFLSPSFTERDYQCPNCKLSACRICKAIHTDYSCEQYQERQKVYSELADFQPAITITTTANDDDELMKFIPALVEPNDKEFVCILCSTTIPLGVGIQFVKCQHSFCKSCISDYVESNMKAEIFCPYRLPTENSEKVECNRMLLLLDIKPIVSSESYDIYTQLLACSGFQLNETIARCFDSECNGFKLFDDCDEIPSTFKCNKCKLINCVQCGMVHEGIKCKQAQDLIGEGDSGRDMVKMFVEMINSGIMLSCPGCGILIEKNEGCDQVECSQCHMEICWLTRGPRWGPAGHGDISGGCRCGVGGRKCHPDCKYCH